MAPKRGAGAKGTPRATRAKSAASASSDTVGIPELFKKVKADLQPDALKQQPQIQEKAALEPATVARSAAGGAGGLGDAADAAAAARAPTVPLVEPAAPPQAPLAAAEDELLRDFDLDIAFGPSLGLTRKERWQRAEGAPPSAPHSTSSHPPDHHLNPSGLSRASTYPAAAFSSNAQPNRTAFASPPAPAPATTSTTSDSNPSPPPPPARLRLGPPGASDGGALQGSSGLPGRRQRLLSIRRLCCRRVARRAARVGMR